MFTVALRYSLSRKGQHVWQVRNCQEHGALKTNDFRLPAVRAWLGQPVGLVGVVSGDMGEGEGQSGPPADWQIQPRLAVSELCQRWQKWAACYSVLFRNFPLCYSWIKVSLCCTLRLGFRKTVNNVKSYKNWCCGYVSIIRPYSLFCLMCLTLTTNKAFQKHQSLTLS